MEPSAFPKPQNVVFKDIAKSLQCQICLCTMTDPRTLPCGHNFCRECIESLATVQRSNRSSTLRCPNNCHQKICTDLDSVKDLPRNFTLCSIIESMDQAERCEIHDDYVGFIDITDGKLFCEHCLKNKKKTYPATLGDPSATPSTAVTIPSLSLSPEILTLSIAEDAVRSKLENSIIQSGSLVVQMEYLEGQFRSILEASEEKKRETKRQIDSMFHALSSALSDQQTRLMSLVDGMGDDNVQIGKSAASLSKAIATISKTAEDTSVMLNAQRRQAAQVAQDKLIPFLRSAIQLQSSFSHDLDAASKSLIAAKNLNVFKRPSEILVTCPTMSSLLVTLRSLDLFKVTKMSWYANC